MDRHYRRNIRLARKYGLKVGSYHLMSAGSSVTTQFRDFQKMVKKGEQDLIPVLDVEEKGIQEDGRDDSYRIAYRCLLI